MKSPVRHNGCFRNLGALSHAYWTVCFFSQVIDYLPMHIFRRCVARYGGNRYMKKFSCFDQYPWMSFAQLTDRESLRDIEVCLRAQ